MKTKESLEKFRIPVPSFMDIPTYEEQDDHGFYSTGAFKIGEHIEKTLKQATCNHSAYKMIPIWGGIFGVCWECTKCGTIKQELEEYK